jgi:hypothetical protein
MLEKSRLPIQNEVVLVATKAYSTYLSNIDELMPTKPHLEKHSPYGQKEMMGMLEE